MVRASHRSSEDCRFDPRLRLRNCFSGVILWRSFMCHLFIVIRHQDPSMITRYVSNPQAGLETTCPYMKIEKRKVNGGSRPSSIFSLWLNWECTSNGSQRLSGPRDWDISFCRTLLCWCSKRSVFSLHRDTNAKRLPCLWLQMFP